MSLDGEPTTWRVEFRGGRAAVVAFDDGNDYVALDLGDNPSVHVSLTIASATSLAKALTAAVEHVQAARPAARPASDAESEVSS